MAQNRYISLHSTQSGAIPTASGMFVGEIAVNTADGKLYTRHGNYVVALNDTTNFISSSNQVVALIDGQTITPFIVSAESLIGSLTGSISGSEIIAASITLVDGAIQNYVLMSDTSGKGVWQQTVPSASYAHFAVEAGYVDGGYY